MSRRVFRVLAVVFDVVVLGFSALMFRRFTFSDLPDYPMQVTALTLGSAALSLFFLRDWGQSPFRQVMVFLRTLAFALLTVTVPLLDLTFLPATLSFTILLAFHASMGEFLIAEGLWAAVAVVVFFLFPNTNGPRSIWGYELQLYTVCAVAIAVCTLAIRGVVEELKEARSRIAGLTEEIDRLAHANVGFQQYASLLEQETSRAERLRLSREIHDSAGYSLTTLKMLFEAARGLIVKDPSQLDKLMREGAKVSQRALQEIRFVLHELRGKAGPLPEGMQLVVLLVRNFEKACGIAVKLETTNTKGSYGPRVNATLYRMVQEGMTNAFHHGRATQVSILLAEVEGNLSIRIRDNGRGSSTVTKGIGLSGMEERVAEAGGWMDYHTLVNGFEISALIPIQEEP